MNKEIAIANSKDKTCMFPDFMTINPYISKKYNLTYTGNRTYHYTDINGFMGIIEEKCFWASNIHFQNDRKEYYDGLTKAISILDKFISSSNSLVLGNYFKKLKEEINSGFSTRITGEFSREDVFTISFCENGDLLSQWRGYGGYSGISIGFDTDNLVRYTRFKEKTLYGDESLPYQNSYKIILPSKVIYDDKQKEEILQDVIEIGINFINSTSEKSNPDCGVELSVSGVSSALYLLFPLFKDFGFAEEKEARYVEQFVKNQATKIYFRERSGILLPYVKLKILDVNYQPIEELPIGDIIVGPSKQQALVIESVKYFLNKKNMGYLVEKVRPSDIPYRG